MSAADAIQLSCYKSVCDSNENDKHGAGYFQIVYGVAQKLSHEFD